MLDIFNKLEPFFEDVYREIAVREYSRDRKTSPPTASKLLKEFSKEGILIMREDRNLLLFRANRENYLFKDLATTYWRDLLSKELRPIRERLLFKRIILFGSIYKAENRIDSDIDLFVDIKPTKIDFSTIEKRLRRKIQIHFENALKNEHLRANMEEGVEI